MKKIMIVVCLAVLIILSACSETQVQKLEREDYSMFVVVESAEVWEVVYHKKTKVMYVVSCGFRNYGVFTVMVDENGKPLLWEKD